MAQWVQPITVQAWQPKFIPDVFKIGRANATKLSSELHTLTMPHVPTPHNNDQYTHTSCIALFKNSHHIIFTFLYCLTFST